MSGGTEVEADAALPAQTEKDPNSEFRRFMNRPLVRSTDMEEEFRVEAAETVVTALERFPANYENASRAVKEAMDKKTGLGWHCVIGEGFGFEVTHEMKSLLYMYFGNLGILLYKCV